MYKANVYADAISSRTKRERSCLMSVACMALYLAFTCMSVNVVIDTEHFATKFREICCFLTK